MNIKLLIFLTFIIGSWCLQPTDSPIERDCPGLKRDIEIIKGQVSGIQIFTTINLVLISSGVGIVLLIVTSPFIIACVSRYVC